MKKNKGFGKKLRHSIPFLIYTAVCLVWFALLERTGSRDYRIIHVSLDDSIPFCEVFIIPYLLWFGYVAAVIIYLFFINKQDYIKICIFLLAGMTVFLLISTLWPNGHNLRPAAMPRDNCFTRLISVLWRIDTPTNLWPSIHVFFSMGAHFALMRNGQLARAKFGRPVRAASAILCLSIILSTVLIKQHSLFDVATGILMGVIMYALVYGREWLPMGRLIGKKRARVTG